MVSVRATCGLVLAVVCIGLLCIQEPGKDAPVSLESAAAAEQVAKWDERAYKKSYDMAKEDRSKVGRETKLADQDGKIRKSILMAGDQKRANAMDEEKNLMSIEHKEQAVSGALQALQRGMADAQADEKRSAWGMQQHAMASKQVLSEVRAITAARVRDGEALAKSLKETGQQRVQGDEVVAKLRQGLEVLARARVAEARIAKRARMATLEAGYDAGRVRLLNDQSRVLQTSALVLQRRGRGGSAEGAKMRAMAKEEMGLEESEEKAAQSVEVLKAKADEAAHYLGILHSDMAAAERRVDLDHNMVAHLAAKYRLRLAADARLERGEGVLSAEERRGIAAVKANEAAFRHDEADYVSDHKAVAGAAPELEHTEKTLQALASEGRHARSEADADARAYNVDVRQAVVLERAEGDHMAAGTAMGYAAEADGMGAEGLLKEGRRSLDLAKEDKKDVADSDMLTRLMHGGK